MNPDTTVRETMLRRSESAAGQREFLRRCCREPIPVQTGDYVGDTIKAAKALIHGNYYLDCDKAG